MGKRRIAMKKRVLFVDDESRILLGLRRTLHSYRNEIEGDFAQSGEEALDAMAKAHYDVIVSDMQMPGMDGARLLTQVMEEHPDTVRILLSGYQNQEMTLRAIGPAHQYLAKPSEPEVLHDTIIRACSLRDLLSDEALKSVVSGMPSLPSIPSVLLDLSEELRSPDASVGRVGEIVSKDVGMSAKILQLVNSAFFGLRRHVASPTEAASLLGLETIQALLMVTGVFSVFQVAPSSKFSLSALWNHCIIVGTLAKNISQWEGQGKRMVDASYLAGLLHDTGKLILATKRSADYDGILSQAEIESVPVWNAEKRTLGATHAEIGAYLLGLWGLEDLIIEAVAYHHRPSVSHSRDFSALTAVHIADVMAREQELIDNPTAVRPTLDDGYLEEAGIGPRMETLREKCRSVTAEVS
jgi:HD-like signal output (HDOD) protein